MDQIHRAPGYARRDSAAGRKLSDLPLRIADLSLASLSVSLTSVVRCARGTPDVRAVERSSDVACLLARRASAALAVDP